MFNKLLVVAGLLGVALAFPTPENLPLYAPVSSDNLYEDHEYKSDFKEVVKKPYAFDYGVRDDYTGANFGHQEDSDGKVIRGSYTVALPDGRIQRVSYTVDHESGFQAEVTYEGKATYPEHPTYENLHHQGGPPHSPYQPTPQQSAPDPAYALSQPSPEDRDVQNDAQNENFLEYN